MPACPAGHDSTATDFCDVCGIRIDGATPGSAPAQVSGTVQADAPRPSPPAEPCPQCGTERSGQFCEACGFDFASRAPTAAPATPTPSVQAAPAELAPQVSAAPAELAPQVSAAPAPTPQAPPSREEAAGSESGSDSGWAAVASADREYFDRVVAAGGPDASTLEFPAYCPERRFVLSGREMRIGRRSVSRGLDPEIDLTGPPADPGISHMHAVLIAQPGGGWGVLDPGSSNGTQVNGVDIATGQAVPLRAGDRICIGAWTVLTIDNQRPDPPASTA